MSGNYFVNVLPGPEVTTFIDIIPPDNTDVVTVIENPKTLFVEREVAGPVGIQGPSGAQGPTGATGPSGPPGTGVTVTKGATEPSDPALGDFWIYTPATTKTVLVHVTHGLSVTPYPGYQAVLIKDENIVGGEIADQNGDILITETIAEIGTSTWSVGSTLGTGWGTDESELTQSGVINDCVLDWDMPPPYQHFLRTIT